MPLLYQTVAVEKELSCEEKLLIYQSVHVLTLTYGRELWVVTERTRSWVQAAEIRFLWRVAGLGLSSEIWREAQTSGGSSEQGRCSLASKGAN